MGSLGWAAAAPKPHAGNSNGDTAIEFLSEVATSLVLVWFGRQRATALIFFEAPKAVYSVLGAVGPRAVAAPMALPFEIDGSCL